MRGLSHVSGDLPVVLELWAVEKIPDDSLFRRLGSDRTELPYLVCSRFIERATLRARVGDRVLEFAHREHTDLDRSILGLQTEPVPVVDLERFIADPKDPKARICTIELVFTYYEVLRLILRGMTGSQGEFLADSTGALPDLIGRAMPKLDPEIDALVFETAPKHRHVVNLAAVVESVIVYPSVGDGPSEVRVSVVLDLFGDEYATFIEDIMAMFWSELATLDDNEVRRFAPYVAKIRHNVVCFLAAHVPLSRGERRMTALVDMHVGMPYPGIVRQLRNRIDEHLIVGNYWMAMTEDEINEGHHSRVSAVVGTLTSAGDWASAVYFLRSALGRPGLPGDLNLISERKPGDHSLIEAQEHVFLSSGLAHCGEHSLIAFGAIRRLIKAKNPWLETVARVAAIEEDHAFVIVNGALTEQTIIPETDRAYLDIDKAVQLSTSLDPAILDAYLDPSAIAESIRDFIDRQKRLDGHSLCILLADHKRSSEASLP